MRRFDLGIASYGASRKLERTLSSIQEKSRTDWRCFIVDNPGPDPETRAIIEKEAGADSRFVPVFLDENEGYAGAVNKILKLAETEYIGYLDNDIRIQTRGWDESLCQTLDRFHEIGMIFPNGGPYELDRGNYREILWGVGFAWILNRLAMSDTGWFDTEIGHQEEADYCLRLRMAGYKCAARPDVQIQHDATATSNPASTERINRGVVRFVDKWCRYFCGQNVGYHSPNVLRWEDWPPNALYLEEYWKARFNGLNDEPEIRDVGGIKYDFLKVPRLSGFYRGRII